MASSKSGTTPVKRDSHTVSPADEPSAEWGWHGTFPKANRIVGWVSAAFLLLLLIGNHDDWLADLWMVCLAAGLIAFLLADAVRSRSARR